MKKDISPLADNILSSYLSLVHKNKKNGQVAQIVDQLVFIENMAKQPKFSLTEHQVLRIHMQFKNMYKIRRELFEKENKQKIRDKIMREENKVCTHQP